jgi:hypothetical protein
LQETLDPNQPIFRLHHAFFHGLCDAIGQLNGSHLERHELVVLFAQAFLQFQNSEREVFSHFREGLQLDAQPSSPFQLGTNGSHTH